MNVALAPSETILMSWEQYVSRNFNRGFIPWDRYRYSKNGRNKVVIVRSRNQDGSSYNYNEFKTGEPLALTSFPELNVTVEKAEGRRQKAEGRR